MRRRRGLNKGGPVFKKLDHDHIRSLGVTKKPTLDYSWRRGAEASQIPSLGITSPLPSNSTPTRSVMDPVALQKESPEVRAQILAKSQRIAIAYNKGAYQYVTEETDPATLGSRSRR